MGLKEALERYGEPWCYNHQHDFELESAEFVADFYNNGGLEFYDKKNKERVVVTYAAEVDDELVFGCWIWKEGQDFDQLAEWGVFKEEDFSEQELMTMYFKIKDIYGQD